MTLKNDAAVELWSSTPVGSQRSTAEVGSEKFFSDIEKYRYGYETPWISKVFNFASLSGKRVLEVGVGLGVDAVAMARCGASYTGIDVIQRHLDLASKNLSLNGLHGTLIHGDLLDSPLEDASFDVVYSFGVLHHIDHEEAILHHISRILRPGGQLRLAVYSKYSAFNLLMIAKWFMGGWRKKCTLDQYRSHLAELSPIDQPVTIKIRSKAEVLKLLSQQFKVLQYHKRGFVQRYLPLVGRICKPDGVVLTAMGSMLGWYHCFELTRKH
jgi:2-polyprenyl-3-methyl-5-hydroxy-6-metoxy-1,4-benzoquinol methylase